MQRAAHSKVYELTRHTAMTNSLTGIACQEAVTYGKRHSIAQARTRFTGGVVGSDRRWPTISVHYPTGTVGLLQFLQ